ncbi:MAG: sulfatase family protein [Pirellulales bacterium]
MNRPLVVPLAAVVAMACTAAAAADRRPNVVVILADDLGWGDVGCNNPDRGRVPTPRIDALAAEGMRFTDGHATSAACSPSRYSLVTGRYHWRTRLQRGIVGMWEPPLIAPERLTIASLAASHGYHTACVGKWHLGREWPIADADVRYFKGLGGPSGGGRMVAKPSAEHRAAWRRTFEQPIPGGPTSHGFSEAFGPDVPNWPPYCFIEGDRTVGIPTALLPVDQVADLLATAQGPALPDWKLDYILPALVDRAGEIIRREATARRPFLLYVPLTSPHTPIAVGREWRGRSGLGVDYADFVMQTDAAVGGILDAIGEAGIADDTLVIFTSDNGCETKVGLKELAARGHFPSGPFRGYKRDVWEGGHRVPFIVRWPAVVPQGRVCGHIVSSVDVMATLADILGADLPASAGEDSVSLVPLLSGGSKSVRASLVHQSYSGVFAIRVDRWKLIFGPGSGPPDSTPAQLYDLVADPGETTDLAAEHPEEVARLRGAMKRLVADGRSTPGGAQANDVAVAIRKDGGRQKSPANGARRPQPEPVP